MIEVFYAALAAQELSDDIPTSWLTGGGMGAMVAGLYWGLYKGWLLTGREGNEKNAEIAENRNTIRELLTQNSALIVERDVAVKTLEAFKAVAEAQMQPRGSGE